MAFIISNTDFVNEPSRSGSDKDLDNLREMLDSLGFTSLLEENLKSNVIICTLIKKKITCFVNSRAAYLYDFLRIY